MADYVEQIAKITSVRLGWEDHGIFTCQLMFDYGDSGQSAGGYGLDEPRHDEDGEFLGRFGTAYGMEWIMGLMRAVGATWFDEVQGRTVIALLDESGLVRGIKSLPTKFGGQFMFGSVLHVRLRAIGLS